MFQLFKERTFSDYISHTFDFFKMTSSHYFKNFFTINGASLIISTVSIYFFSKIYFEFIFNTINSTGNYQQSSFESYFQNNMGLTVIIGIVLLLFFLISTMMQFSFPVIYLDLYDKKNGVDFNSKDILIGLKERVPKILKFIAGAIFVLTPIFFVLYFICILLCFIIIGIPILFLFFPTYICFVNLLFYFYMNSNQGFFDAFSDALSTIKSQFWHIVGATFIMLILTVIINSIFTTIPYFIMMASVFTSNGVDDVNNNLSSISLIMSMIMVVSYVFGFVINNILFINQGIIYYSHIENENSIKANNPIDLIGTDFE